MAFTHVEIAEHKKRSLALLFLALALLYALSIIAIVWGASVFTYFGPPKPKTYLYSVCFALCFAFFHWLTSVSGMLRSALVSLNAHPADAEDSYHRRFANIVEEACVATGNRYKIAAYVINSAAVNACGFADLNYRAAIVVTEGFLARLTRQQMEACVGHLTGRIVSGDAVVASVFTALFAMHEEAMKRFAGLVEGDDSIVLRTRGRMPIAVVFVIAVVWLTNAARRLCEIFVARAFIYRADAIAVKLTHNPQALAEALRIMSAHWRGYGSRGGSLSALFIMDSGADAAYARREDWIAEWFSAHPPTERRIEVLLGLAGMTDQAIAQWDVEERRVKQERPQTLADIPEKEEKARWQANLEGGWSAPLAIAELLVLPGFGPETWIRPEGAAAAMPAYREPDVMRSLRENQTPEEKASGIECPNCRLGLREILYEGVKIKECSECGGCYAKTNQVTQILAREEYTFSESVRRAAKAIADPKNAVQIRKAYEAEGKRWIDAQCPECGSKMSRKFYTEAYLVEVEQCWICGLTWFDRDELEILQCLYESRKGAHEEDRTWEKY